MKVEMTMVVYPMCIDVTMKNITIELNWRSGFDSCVVLMTVDEEKIRRIVRRNKKLTENFLWSFENQEYDERVYRIVEEMGRKERK